MQLAVDSRGGDRPGQPARGGRSGRLRRFGGKYVPESLTTLATDEEFQVTLLHPLLCLGLLIYSH
jgi:hypothetical protein